MSIPSPRCRLVSLGKSYFNIWVRTAFNDGVRSFLDNQVCEESCDQNKHTGSYEASPKYTPPSHTQYHPGKCWGGTFDT